MAALLVGVGSPEPPFNGMPGGGLDIDLMTALGSAVGESVEFIADEASADFGAVLERLAAGEYDCVAAAVTTTPEREHTVAFLPPYVISGQGLAVDTVRLPQVRSIDDLSGLTVGVQRGDTSEAIAGHLVAEGRVARVRIYDYGAAGTAVADLTAGGCDAVLELAPVLSRLVSQVPDVEIVQSGGISTEQIAVAVNPADQALLARLQVAQAELEEDGTLQRLRRKWLGNPYVDQSLAVS
ncbi:ABC transporter substrate-binding protein [Mycobacterium sp. G7A2]|uniref:ABC transporter substrate-binding protein n=1 Tax=Mycobacterium sp. G7A2 TaxID=3317307 RepID=UPI001C843A41|nr:ABC transporter substrate-binding protein [Mycolicibacterium aurantiacum]